MEGERRWCRYSGLAECFAVVLKCIRDARAEVAETRAAEAHAAEALVVEAIAAGFRGFLEVLQSGPRECSKRLAQHGVPRGLRARDSMETI